MPPLRRRPRGAKKNPADTTEDSPAPATAATASPASARSAASSAPSAASTPSRAFAIHPPVPSPRQTPAQVSFARRHSSRRTSCFTPSRTPTAKRAGESPFASRPRVVGASPQLSPRANTAQTSPRQTTARVSEAQIKQLQADLHERREALRQKYTAAAACLRARLELRLHRIPPHIRTLTLAQLLELRAQACSPARPAITISA
ncbi:uncharacterized protein V1518DRAFT_421672 [Limtongia smithiae]|uniref:uncharacterized protein n=1 Tax=Limtongia smithiae TaxID=1125753 RepID=UPI0034CE079A